MKFFLDANVLIDIANEPADATRIQTRLDAAGPRNCAISAIIIEELHFGVLSGPAAKKGYQVRNLKALIAAFAQVDFTPDAARAAAALRPQLGDRRKTPGQKLPGAADLLLAGHALSEHRAVASADTGFALLTGINVRNWRL